jgi:hypothetical protein
MLELWKGFMKYVVEIASGGLIHVADFITIGSRILVILRLLPQQFHMLQCWYY